MKTFRLLPFLLLAVSFTACSSDSGSVENQPEPPVPPVKEQLRINIRTAVEAVTRATDYAFEQGDQIGLFVVNHKADGSAQTLKLTGNHVDNMRFTYNNGAWNPDTPIYWSDNKTSADFYLYYPYTAGLSTVTAVPFSPQADQRTEAAYKQGDFMTGSAPSIAPTDKAVSINARHVMSKMLIVLAPGNGFTKESLSKASISVKIRNVKLQSTVDIATGTVTATGNATDVLPLLTDEGYTALLPPQAVAGGNLITVTVDGRDYNLSKAFTFKGSTRHKFTVTLSKVSNGVNVNITKWEDDGVDYGGTAE